MTILVTGPGGFVGSLLVPRLLAAGHTVRALARHPERAREILDEHMDSEDVELIRGDVLLGEGLDRAMAGAEVAYYLIHSMERARRGPASFAERERVAADNFAAAARRAGVRRIVYLGGLVPRWDLAPTDGAGGAPPPRSRHLASREEVERILLAATADSVALRASIVIGARSRSFRLLVHLVERMPVLTLPAWERFRTQPIDQRDVIEMLAACVAAPVGGRSFEVGGPDVLSYGQMLRRIAELMLVRRPALRLPVTMTGLTGRIVSALVSEEPELVVPLMEGLQGDLLAADGDAAELLGVRLHSFDAAVERALAEWEEFEPLAAR